MARVDTRYEAQTIRLAARLATDANPLTRAAYRRLWLQGRPAYERVDDRLYAWWPDGRLVPADGQGPVGYVDPKVILHAQN